MVLLYALIKSIKVIEETTPVTVENICSGDHDYTPHPP